MTCHFGGKWSASWWSRLGAFLVRLLHRYLWVSHQLWLRHLPSRKRHLTCSGVGLSFARRRCVKWLVARDAQSMACCPMMDGISVVGAAHSVGDTIAIATLPKSFGWVGGLLNLRWRHRLFLRNRRRLLRLNLRLLRGTMCCPLPRLLTINTMNNGPVERQQSPRAVAFFFLFFFQRPACW